MTALHDCALDSALDAPAAPADASARVLKLYSPAVAAGSPEGGAVAVDIEAAWSEEWQACEGGRGGESIRRKHLLVC